MDKPERIWEQVRLRVTSELELVKDTVTPRSEGLETTNPTHWVSAPGPPDGVGEKFPYNPSYCL